MADIQEQTQLAAEIQEQISSPPINADLDEVRCLFADPPLIRILTCCFQDELKRELEELEQDQLNDMLKGAEPAPIHLPPGATKTTEGMLLFFCDQDEVC